MGATRGGGVAVCGWVVVQAVRTRHIPGQFQQWTNWSNILALLVGGVGTVLVIVDKVTDPVGPTCGSSTPRRNWCAPGGGAVVDRAGHAVPLAAGPDAGQGCPVAGVGVAHHSEHPTGGRA